MFGIKSRYAGLLSEYFTFDALSYAKHFVCTDVVKLNVLISNEMNGLLNQFTN